MAYTIQTVVLFGGLWIMNYNAQAANHRINGGTKFGIGFIAFGAPMIFLLVSLAVFRKKFKLYGELADNVHNYIILKRGETVNTKIEK